MDKIDNQLDKLLVELQNMTNKELNMLVTVIKEQKSIPQSVKTILSKMVEKELRRRELEEIIKKRIKALGALQFFQEMMIEYVYGRDEKLNVH
ncbi:hypothetical protein GND95_08790 [Defluviitalea raffinosedens]|uniref:Uncharacterized protein n=1 Tax=Defluviitalea raffinosedens TaxID=1450156 RepID=A0A7C8HEA4_9FIRM|nr:hypothetical protein [Defluviitalea raffinosedens]KAE9633740.1 hypothetical protein GND95_08790 [Defluviitalea raffinosedens]